MMKPGALSAEKSENSDAIKRLYRGASDVVRKLDKVLKNATSVQDCYKTNVVILRTRLREICERLMFLDPVGHGKKAEDLLWRKVHYEAISSSKNFRKNPSWSTSDQHWISHHIKLGIGTYHHLMFRLQSEFQLNEGIADFLPLSDSRGSLKEKPAKSTNFKMDSDHEVAEWALQSYQRCLICMGDLTRYHQELCGGKMSPVASRYYHQALLVCPQSSMPHNQLGTLVGSKHYNCDAAYFYMRCVMGNNGFEGARGNLRRIFEKNLVSVHECAFHPTDGLSEQQIRELQVKTFLVGFLQYCEVCFKYPAIDPDLPFGQLCQMLVENFQKCLGLKSYERSLTKLNGNELLNASKLASEATNICCNEETPCHLSESLIFKIFIMSLMCLEKLDKEASACASAATALTLATFSHLLYFILIYFKKVLIEKHDDANTNAFITVPNHDQLSSVPGETDHQFCVNSSQDNKSQSNMVVTIKHPKELRKQHIKKGSLRFRRKLHIGLSLEDSDLSEGEATSSSENEQEEFIGSDISENEDTDRSSPATEEDQKIDGEDGVLNDQATHSDRFNASPKNSQPSNGSKESTTCFEGANENSSVIDIQGQDNNLGHTQSSNNDKNAEDIVQQTTEPEVNEFNHYSVEELLQADKLLPVVKMCCDWLKCSPQIITASAQGSQKLWSRYVELLNLLAVIKTRLSTGDVCDAVLKKCKTWHDAQWQQMWPLPEDIILKGLPLFSNSQESLQFESMASVWFTNKEEVLLRIACLQNLGFFLSSYSELGITYDVEKESFSLATLHQTSRNCNNNNIVRKKRGKSWIKHNSEGKMQERKKHLMRNMAQLWLEAQVKELESSLQSTCRPKFSPYLIPDSSVLIDNLHLIRQLMTSKVFIFILPITVLQCLDRVKKESIKARDAIRWLEGEFQKHNRYLRAQKQHERLTLSLLKYPKRKEKEAWNVFLILECANYFARHGSTTNDLSANLVTVLTTENAEGSSGGASEKHNYNLLPLAGSAGLKVETIEELHNKWLASSKPQN